MLKIGILDYGEINGVSDREKIGALLDLVVLVDEIGFSRYWLAEHYEEGAAWKNPETLLGILAGLTDRMKIGSAGVLLNVHNPLRIALNFRMLELLYPGRIDLGIARGRTNTETEFLLKGGFVADNYSLPYHDKADQLINYLRSEHIDIGRENKLVLSPYLPSPPDIWVLGGGNSSLSIAIKHGVSFCLSLFHNSSANHLSIISEFRLKYYKLHGALPKVCVAICGTCAPSKNEAVNSLQKNYLSKTFTPNFIGSPRECVKQIVEIQKRFQPDEVVILDLAHNYQQKLVSYQSLSKEFGW